MHHLAKNHILNLSLPNVFCSSKGDCFEVAMVRDKFPERE